MSLDGHGASLLDHLSIFYGLLVAVLIGAALETRTRRLLVVLHARLQRLHVGEYDVGAARRRLQYLALDEVGDDLAVGVLLLMREHVLGGALGVAQLQLAHRYLALHLGLHDRVELGDRERLVVEPHLGRLGAALMSASIGHRHALLERGRLRLLLLDVAQILLLDVGGARWRLLWIRRLLMTLLLLLLDCVGDRGETRRDEGRCGAAASWWRRCRRSGCCCC